MGAGYKALSALSWIGGAIQLFFMYFFLFAPDTVQPLWDYVVDPIMLVLFALVIIASVDKSLNRRNRGLGLQNLPMDIHTIAVGATGLLYLHNYLRKFAGGFDPDQNLWTYLSVATVITLVIAAISFWRDGSRAAREAE